MRSSTMTSHPDTRSHCRGSKVPESLRKESARDCLLRHKMESKELQSEQRVAYELRKHYMLALRRAKVSFQLPAADDAASSGTCIQYPSVWNRLHHETTVLGTMYNDMVGLLNCSAHRQCPG